jgi:hypothetical protein
VNTSLQFDGKTVDPALFGAMKPLEILYDAGGQQIFTFLLSNDECVLAYQCWEEVDSVLFLVVPAKEATGEQLRSGSLTVREALYQPWAWIVQRDSEGNVVAAKAVAVDSLPSEALPRPGVYLWPDLQPLFQMRMLGSTLRPGTIPASVIKSGFERAYGALRTLVTSALDMHSASGRPEDWVRRFYDLPTQRLAFGSLEIAFSKPQSPQPLTLDALTGAIELDDAEIERRMSQLLAKGLDWIEVGDTRLPGEFPLEQEAILEALSQLSPPQKGAIESVEISGQLVNRSRVLSRQATAKIRVARALLPRSEHFVDETGFIRELDLDLKTFTLRTAAIGGQDILSGWVPDALLDDAFEAMVAAYKVRVRGRSYGIGQPATHGVIEVSTLEPVPAARDVRIEPPTA